MPTVICFQVLQNLDFIHLRVQVGLIYSKVQLQDMCGNHLGRLLKLEVLLKDKRFFARCLWSG